MRKQALAMDRFAMETRRPSYVETVLSATPKSVILGIMVVASWAVVGSAVYSVYALIKALVG